MKLTEKRIRDAAPKGKPYYLTDDQATGLFVKVHTSGTKAFGLLYRIAGRQRRMTLGRVGEMSLIEARDRAKEAMVKIRADGDDPLERRQERQIAPTVAEVADRWLGEYSDQRIAAGRMKESTRRKYRQQIGRYVLPKIGRRRVADIERQDIEHIVLPCPPVERNRVLAAISRLFTLAEHWQLRPQYTNPVRGIERSREVARDRVLTADEMNRLGKELDTLADTRPSAVAAIRLCALLGWRISEALSLRWDDIEYGNRRAILADTKTGKSVRPLSSAALALLDSLPRIDDFVFASSRSGVAVHYATAREAFMLACARAGLEDARLHDLRRGFATGMAASGTGLTVLRDALGHKTIAMATRYARQADQAVAAAVEDTGAEVAARLGIGAKVIPLRRERRHG